MQNSGLRYIHQVVSKLYARLKFPQYNQYMDTYKMPNNPKIIVFGNSQQANQIIQSEFNGYNKLNGETFIKEGDQKSAYIVADSILRVGENFADGHLIQNYPKNIQQAQNLDTMIDGINIAIKFTSKGEQTPKELDPVLKYYEERGCLVEFSLDQTGDISSKLQDAILANIKL